MVTLTLLAGVAAGDVPGFAAAVPEVTDVVIGHEIELPSPALGRPMRLRVYLPEGYSIASSRYPVLYTFQSYFHHVSGVARYLAGMNLAPEMMVVSVESYSSADLSPEPLAPDRESGGAEGFVRFLGDELVPFIDDRYRTQPYRLLYSGSFGGGFVVYVALTRPETFHAYLASTPAIDYEGQSRLIGERAEGWLKEGEFHHRYLFLAVEDAPALVETLEVLIAVMRRAAPPELVWEYHHWPEEDHGTIPHRAVFQGLRRAFARWSELPEEVVAGGADTIRAYQRQISEWYGYGIGISRGALFRAAYGLLSGDPEQAAGIATLLTRNYPQDPFGHRLLGTAFEQDGRLDLAFKAYERAHALAVETASPHLSVFVESLASVRRQIDAAGGAPEIEVLAVANAGFLVRSGQKTVLVDALFRATAPYPEFFQQGPSESLLKRMLQGEGAFGHVDVALVTHHHADHHDARTAVAFLERHPETVLVGTAAVAGSMADQPGFERVADRVRVPALTSGECADLEANGITVRVCRGRHSGSPGLTNHLYRVDLAGFRWVHEGDADLSAATFRDLELGGEGLDLAFLHSWWVTSDAGRDVVGRWLRPRAVVLMHDRWAMAEATRGRLARLPSEVLRALPPVTVFGTELGRETFGSGSR